MKKKTVLYQPHIKCTKGDIAKYVLIPGDPARAAQIAGYFKNGKEVANNREFRSFTGTYKGIEVSVTSTGIGGPSTSIAIEELAAIGAKTFLRVGTCGALKRGIHAGDLIIPYAAVRARGTTKEYMPPEYPAVADPEVFQALVRSAKTSGYTYFTGVDRCHDAFYEHVGNFVRWGEIFRDDRMKKWNYPLVSSEMECAVAMLLPNLMGLSSGCVLAVNTPEALEDVVKDPNMIYRLDETKSAKSGVDEAILTALESIVLLESNGKC